MGEMVDFPSNGGSASGYLATPAGGAGGPGVLVIQEWWGLHPQLKRVCDRFAAEGFVALAPDLYHGELAQHDEMDRAGELMNSLPHDRAARDMSGAVDFLIGHDATSGSNPGVVGFCMGGLLALVLGANAGDRLGAVVSYYGAPLGDMAPDWKGLTAPVLVHIAENDGFFAPPAMHELITGLKAQGKDITDYTYPGTGHAFANEDNPLGTHDADARELAWTRTLEFLRAKLG
jgi:carboxymethylenebutenolidase